MNTYKSFYKTVGGGEGDRCNYPTRLDLYGKGCYYDCSYCYSKQMLNFRKLWHPDNVGVAPLLDVFKTIKKIPTGSVVRLGGMTDCFQPIEKRYKNTYNTIKALNRKGIHYLIVTKSYLVATQKYLEILDHNLAHIQVSIPTNKIHSSIQSWKRNRIQPKCTIKQISRINIRRNNIKWFRSI